jgi:hypothetical protein
MQGNKMSKVVGKATRIGGEPRRQDTMFGLMVIQQQLRVMQRRLDSLDTRLADVQGQLDRSAERSTEPAPGERSGVDEKGGNGVAGADRLQDPVRGG